MDVGGVKFMSKRMIALITSVVLLLGTLFGSLSSNTAEAAGINFQQISITELDSLENFDQKVALSWSIDWNLNEDNGISSSTRYAKFTLKKKSIVRIKSSTEDKKSFASKECLALYGNESMGTAIVTNDIGYDEGDDWLLLDAGTYYLKCSSTLYMSGSSNHRTKVSIGAVAQSKAVEVTQSVNSKKKTVKIRLKQHIASSTDSYRIAWAEGKVYDADSSSFKPLKTNAILSRNKNGWITICIKVNSSVAFNQELNYLVRIKVSGIDKTAPTVTGVKNGRTYKKAVTIRFKDNKGGSGIKSATLNGKKIKSGKKIKKAGTYTLKVTDKAGNRRTVKFKIKK